MHANAAQSPPDWTLPLLDPFVWPARKPPTKRKPAPARANARLGGGEQPPEGGGAAADGVPSRPVVANTAPVDGGGDVPEQVAQRGAGGD